MALVHRRAGRLDEAKSLRERILAEKAQGDCPTDPDTARNLGNLGVILSRQGRHEEALDLFRQALERVEAQAPPQGSNQEAVACANYGAELMRLGRGTEAQDHLERSLHILEKVIGLSENHFGLHVIRGHYGRCLVELGRRRMGLAIIRRARSDLTRLLGEEHEYPRQLTRCLVELDGESRDTDR